VNQEQLNAIQLLIRDCPGHMLGTHDTANKRRELFGALQTLALDDWAVRVLDAWAALNPGWAWRSIASRPRCCCEGTFIHAGREPLNDERFDCYGDTPYAARLAAVEAVFPELPADVRQVLGEKP
jgi:hypothetical protein